MSANKQVIEPLYLVQAASMTGNITSSVVPIQTYDNVGIQLNWTLSPIGSFFVDVSIDGNIFNPITLSPAPVAAGTAGSEYIDLNQLSASFIRVRYVAASGTGALDVYLTAKTV